MQHEGRSRVTGRFTGALPAVPACSLVNAAHRTIPWSSWWGGMTSLEWVFGGVVLSTSVPSRWRPHHTVAGTPRTHRPTHSSQRHTSSTCAPLSLLCIALKHCKLCACAPRTKSASAPSRQPRSPHSQPDAAHTPATHHLPTHTHTLTHPPLSSRSARPPDYSRTLAHSPPALSLTYSLTTHLPISTGDDCAFSSPPCTLTHSLTPTYHPPPISTPSARAPHRIAPLHLLHSQASTVVGENGFRHHGDGGARSGRVGGTARRGGR
jgi:hypothetical protein